jgi:hypothetical protein
LIRPSACGSWGRTEREHLTWPMGLQRICKPPTVTFIFVFPVLEIESRALQMLDNYSATWSIPPPHPFVFEAESGYLWAGQNLWSSFCCLPSSWDYRCVPPHPAPPAVISKSFMSICGFVFFFFPWGAGPWQREVSNPLRIKNHYSSHSHSFERIGNQCPGSHKTKFQSQVLDSLYLVIFGCADPCHHTILFFWNWGLNSGPHTY